MIKPHKKYCDFFPLFSAIREQIIFSFAPEVFEEGRVLMFEFFGLSGIRINIKGSKENSLRIEMKGEKTGMKFRVTGAEIQR